MKCLHCGMPLSPKRTHCPRCGAAISGRTDAPAQPASIAWQPPIQQAQGEQLVSPWTPPHSGQHNPEVNTQNSGYGQSFPHHPGNWGQALPPISAKVPYATPSLPSKKRDLLTPRSGFTIAGSCIAAGMLILLFIFIMGRNLPPADALSSTTVLTPTAIIPTATPIPTVDPGPTPTPTLSGQQYFDGAQLGSEINNDTAQIVTQANSFKLNQKIYVTFQVHTGDRLGAACLLWTWGNHSQTHFEFQLQGSTGAAYSYMPAVAVGTGKVEIFYASSTACTDKVLAQSLDFAVS